MKLKPLALALAMAGLSQHALAARDEHTYANLDEVVSTHLF